MGSHDCSLGRTRIKQRLRASILLPAGTSIVLPVGYMDQPTGLLQIYLWRRLSGRSGGYVDNLHRSLCEF